MTMFQKSVINKHLASIDSKNIDNAFAKFKENYNPSKIQKINKLKEEEYQDGFLRDIFVDVLGYILNPDENHNLSREFKNQADSKKADGAILKDEKAVAVIELKSTKTKDFTKVTEQAFGYKNNQPDCKYVIISNFRKLRFYVDYANEYEEFDLFNLQKDDFDLLYLLLHKDSIFADLPLKLKQETKFHEEDISDKLYKDYSLFKNKLFDNLTKNNVEQDKLTLFKKSQKLLDRFLFILFAEDSGLLPPNSISRIIDTYKQLKELDAYKPIYEIYKQYFGYMNIGRKGKTTADDIPAYNGGLFYPDEILDKLKIDDEILIDDLLHLSEYDFNTDVDVNILGHIFEHSLGEIEEITAEIEGTDTEKTKSKRKKDGVFYTPKYITQYIVENTIGKLCKEKREELKIDEIEFDGTYKTKEGKLSAKGKNLFKILENYKNWLKSLKIIDPACGSGAFLNQALNFLIEEHKTIDDIIAELTGEALRLFDTDKVILENNLYGVDINEESVEIAKLSLWLRTAQKGRKLSNLNANIKCGNSLIDDPEIAGDKAFDWNKEFPEIMQNGGFDCVIGNPPYVRSRGSMSNSEKEYFVKKYKTLSYQPDLYKLFIEKSLNILKEYGQLSFITPSVFLSNDYDKPLRKFILDENYLRKVSTSDEDIFSDASVKTVVFVIEKTIDNNRTINFNKITKGNFIKTKDLPKDVFINQDYVINENINLNALSILKKMDITQRLNTFCEVKNGIKVRKELLFNTKHNNDYKPFLLGKNINICSIDDDTLFIHYIPENEKKYTNQAFRSKTIFEQEKLIVRQILGKRIITTFDNNHYYTDQTTYVINKKTDNINLKYLLSIFNSKLLYYYFKNTFSDNKVNFPKVKRSQILEFPIKIIDEQDLFIEKSNNLLDFYKNLQEKKTKFLNRVKDNFEIEKISKKLDSFYEQDFKTFVAELKKQKIQLSLIQQDEWEEYFNAYKTEINQIQVEINKTDKEIDQMVYKLYELTEEEIKIVEESV